MIFLEGRYAERCGTFVDPSAWGPRALDLALTEGAINLTVDTLNLLFDKLHPKPSDGVFLDICAGNGISTIQVSWPRSIDVFHIDKNVNGHVPLRDVRIAWFLDSDKRDMGYKRAKQYIEHNFLAADVTKLVNDPSPVLKRVPQHAITGAYLLHPDGLPDVIDASIQLAGKLLPPNAPFIITTDASDVDEIERISKRCSDYFSKYIVYPDISTGVYGIIAYK